MEAFGRFKSLWIQPIFDHIQGCTSCQYKFQIKEGKSVTFHLWAIPIVLGLIYTFSVFLHTYTQVHQVTTLTTFLGKQTRTSCNLQAWRSEAHEPWNAGNLHNPFTNTIKSKQIAIMTMSDNAWGVKKEVRQMLENNRLAYAYRHGYTVVNGNHFIDKSLPGKLIDNII